MASNACWGVEVGAGALKAIKLVRDGDSVSVADYLIIPHKRPLSAPETDEREARRLAVGTLVSQRDLSKASLAISIPGNAGFARFAKLPPVDPKKIPEIVKFEAVQQIPFPIDDVQWDYQTFSQPDSPDVEVGIFAVTTDRVNDKLAKWQDVGFTPSSLTLSPLAVFNALSYDQQFRAEMPGTILLDIGTMSTDLIVVQGGRVWIRTFPIGGHHFTEALVAGFNLSYSKAERLKKEAESSEHARKILQAMRSVFSDLEQDVQRSITYYESLYKDAKLTRIIGLGATFQLPGLKKYLSQQLKLEVEALDSFKRLKADGEKNAELQAHAGQFAVAYGLALQGLGLQTLTADLMPVSVVREAVWKEKTKWFIGAGVLAAAAAGAMWIGPVSQKASLPKFPDAVTDAKNTAQRFKGEWSQVESQDKPDLRATGVQSLMEHRELYGYLMDDVGQLIENLRQRDAKVIIDRVTTDYSGTGQTVVSGSTDALSAGPQANRGAAAVDPAAGEQPPRVRLVLEYRTTKEPGEADNMVFDAGTKWLGDLNSKPERANLPYTVEKTDKQIEPKFVKATETVSASGTPDSNPGMPNFGGQGGRGGPVGRPTPGTGAGGTVPFGAPTPPPATGPGGFLGPAAVGAGPGDADKLAPLPPQPPIAAPGSKIIRYTITWYVNIKTGTEKKEGGQ